MRKSLRILIVIYILTVGIFVNLVDIIELDNQEQQDTSVVEKKDSTGIVEKENKSKSNDIIEQENKIIFENNDIDINSKINEILAEEKNYVGFIYYNLITNEEIAFNEEQVVEAASTYKVGLNLICNNMIEEGIICEDDLVYYNENQYQEGTGILQYESNIGPLPLRQLLNYSIVYSDNIAATMVYDYIGGWNNFRNMLYNFLGADYVNYENVTCARNELNILKYIYDNRENVYYKEIIDSMKSTVFHNRIDKYIPEFKVAHKIGEFGTAIHDMGIIFTEEPYILVMLTEGITDADEKIAEVSRWVYLYNTKAHYGKSKMVNLVN